MEKRFKKKKDRRNARIHDIVTKLKNNAVWTHNLEDCANGPTESESGAMAQIINEWSELPAALNPSTGSLKDEARILRKQLQLCALLAKILEVLPPPAPTTDSGTDTPPDKRKGPVCVEFGSGTGHAGLLLAFLRPDCQVVLVERKEWTSKIAAQRAKDSNLTNVVAFTGDLQAFRCDLGLGRRWDLGFSLHSCGALTDLAQELCVEVGASYVLVPCCYGQVSAHGNRSSLFHDALPPEDFAVVSSGADFSVPANDWDFPSTEHFQTAKTCMSILDADRSQWAKERGYRASLTSLHPLNCSPKNNAIIGVPGEMRTGLPEFYDFRPDIYEQQLASKVDSIWRDFLPYLQESGLSRHTLEVFQSPKKHFRLRCRFQVMKINNAFCYLMWENGKPSVKIKDFPIAAEVICHAMPKILQFIEQESVLAEQLQAVHFLSTLSGNLTISLIYQDKDLGDEWKSQAVRLKETLNINLIGRRKGAMCCVDSDMIEECLHLADGRAILYKQIEGSFSNPNGKVNTDALNWLCSLANSITIADTNGRAKRAELLELYCGNGNHTCALAAYFDYIVAVELDKRLCELANQNLATNGISNAEVVQLHSERFSRSLLKKKEYQSDRTNRVHRFNVVLVDPPRAGLDSQTLQLVQRFPFIVYISCNPHEALLNDCSQIKTSHTIARFAVFDQFAYTSHLECGVFMVKK